MTFVKRYPRALVRDAYDPPRREVVLLLHEGDRNSSSQVLTPYEGEAQKLAESLVIYHRAAFGAVEDDHVFDSDSSQDEECIFCERTREEHR